MIPTKRYKGRFRVEFIACLPEIKDLQDKGYSTPMIYDEIFGLGKVTMSYGQFYRYIKKEHVVKHSQIPTKQAPPSAQGVTAPQLPENAKSGFSIPRIADSTLQGDTRSVESLINGNGNKP